jgi:hypothetical protein
VFGTKRKKKREKTNIQLGNFGLSLPLWLSSLETKVSIDCGQKPEPEFDLRDPATYPVCLDNSERP